MNRNNSYAKPEDIKGIHYSSVQINQPIPELWLLDSLTYNYVLDKLKRSTLFITSPDQHPLKKFSLTPFPEAQILVLSYFYQDLQDPQGSAIKLVTLLLHDQISPFIYANFLYLTQYFKLKYLIEYYTNIQLFNSFESAPASNEVCLLFSYFNTRIGPLPFFCYPPNSLEIEDLFQISKELSVIAPDQGSLFKTYRHLSIFHYYFEIPYEFARGRAELCLLSLIFETKPSDAFIERILLPLTELISRLRNTPGLGAAFYTAGLRFKNKLIQVEKSVEMHALLTRLLTDFYTTYLIKTDDLNLKAHLESKNLPESLVDQHWI